MLDSLINILIIILILLVLDFWVERKFKIRKWVVNKVGIIATIFLTIIVVIITDYIILYFFPELERSNFYKLSKIAFVVYFLPKRGDKDETKFSTK